MSAIVVGVGTALFLAGWFIAVGTFLWGQGGHRTMVWAALLGVFGWLLILLGCFAWLAGQ
jgi:hypothetical protein